MIPIDLMAPPYGGDPLLTPKALQTCPTPGCPALTRTGRCDDCLRTARARRRTPEQSSYNSARWRRTRAAYLREHPLCECEEHAAQSWIIRPQAAEVHHVDGLGPLGPRGHDWSNLRSLTKRCHSRLTALEQPAGWNDRE